MEEYYDEDYDVDAENYTSEYELLIEAYNNVLTEINRYTDVVEYLWNEKVIPFIESNDCSILEQISRSNYRKFNEMMFSQPIYLELIASYKKIQKKIDILNKR